MTFSSSLARHHHKRRAGGPPPPPSSCSNNSRSQFESSSSSSSVSSSSSCSQINNQETTTPQNGTPTETNNSSASLAIFCREVRNLLRSKPNCMIPFSKFVPAYHNHYGRQCCVYQFGYTKLIELLEAIPHVVQILGDPASSETCSQQQQQQNSNQRYITLTHREQIKRFASDLIKVVKSAPGKRLKLSQFARAYDQVLGRAFRVEDYGTNDINVLLVEIWEGTINIIPISRESLESEGEQLEPLFVDVPLARNQVLEMLVATNKLTQEPYITRAHPDCWFEIPRRERSDKEIRRTKYFVWDCIELLGKMSDSHYSVPFSKFIPAYHYYFNRQCKVSIFGFSKLIDLFESISPQVVEIVSQGAGEEKLIRLAREHWPLNNNNNNNNNNSNGRRARERRPHSRTSSSVARKLARAHSPPVSSRCSGRLPEPIKILQRPKQQLLAQHQQEAPPRPPTQPAIDSGPTLEELIELEDELKAYEELQAIQRKRSGRMAAILDIFKYSIY